MLTLQDKLAESLAVLKKLQDDGIVAIQTKNITRTHRERLVKSGFIKEVMKGWYSFRLIPLKWSPALTSPVGIVCWMGLTDGVHTNQLGWLK